jgi:hypothetical protein
VGDEPKTKDQCFCGQTQHHKLVRSDVVWCTKCGCLRVIFKSGWQIPTEIAEKEPDTDPDIPRSGDF